MIIYGSGSRTPSSEIELFAKIVNGFEPLIVFAKSSILDVLRVLNPTLNHDWFLNHTQTGDF